MKANALDRMWSLSAAVLLVMSLAALWVYPKFFGVEIHPIFGWAELQSGVSWLEPQGRYVVGALAATMAILLLIPRMRMIGAGAALALSVAFIIAHMTPWLGWNIPNYTPVVEAIAAGRTAADIEAMGLKGDRGAHLTLAVINAGLAWMVLAAEMNLRKPQPQRTRPLELASVG
jgi:hypothetical protein